MSTKKTSKKSGRRKAARRAAPTRAARRGRDGMRAEYDFRGAVRGKYAARYRAGSNVVVLDPDVADAFGDSASVNKALRGLLALLPEKPRRRRTA